MASLPGVCRVLPACSGKVLDTGIMCFCQVYNNDLMDIATLLRLNSGVSTDGSPSSGQLPADIAPVREHILVS